MVSLTSARFLYPVLQSLLSPLLPSSSSVFPPSLPPPHPHRRPGEVAGIWISSMARTSSHKNPYALVAALWPRPPSPSFAVSRASSKRLERLADSRLISRGLRAPAETRPDAGRVAMSRPRPGGIAATRVTQIPDSAMAPIRPDETPGPSAALKAAAASPRWFPDRAPPAERKGHWRGMAGSVARRVAASISSRLHGPDSPSCQLVAVEPMTIAWVPVSSVSSRASRHARVAASSARSKLGAPRENTPANSWARKAPPALTPPPLRTCPRAFFQPTHISPDPVSSDLARPRGGQIPSRRAGVPSIGRPDLRRGRVGTRRALSKPAPRDTRRRPRRRSAARARRP